MESNETSLVDFIYHKHDDFKDFVGYEIAWLNLSNKIKTGILIFEKGKYLLPESGGVNACTVKTFLPKLYET